MARPFIGAPSSISTQFGVSEREKSPWSAEPRIELEPAFQQVFY
jgi:hypothetical protein